MIRVNWAGCPRITSNLIGSNPLERLGRAATFPNNPEVLEGLPVEFGFNLEACMKSDREAMAIAIGVLVGVKVGVGVGELVGNFVAVGVVVKVGNKIGPH